MTEPLVVTPSPAVVEARAWAAVGLNCLMLGAVVVVGVVLVLDGTVRSVVGGVALVLLGAWLASRVLAPAALLVRIQRTRRRPPPARLVVDDDGVTVYNHDAASPTPTHPARLPWEECVAVVASPVQHGPTRGVLYYYLHFMPRAGMTVGDDVPIDRLRLRSQLLGQDAASVATSWVFQSADLEQARAVLDDIRRRRPGLRIVNSIDRTGTVGATDAEA